MARLWIHSETRLDRFALQTAAITRVSQDGLGYRLRTLLLLTTSPNSFNLCPDTVNCAPSLTHQHE